MSGTLDRPGNRPAEIPDLELPPPNAQRSRASLRAVRDPALATQTASTGALEPIAALPDLGDSSELGPKLDLELGSAISGGMHGASSPAGLEHRPVGALLELDFASHVQPGLSLAPEGRPDWPTGVSPARERLIVDPAELRRIANYGTPLNVGPLLALYALRVLVRRRALRRELRRIEQNLARAEEQRDERLAELVAAVRTELHADERWRRALTPIEELEQTANEGHAAVAALDDEARAEIAELDREAAPIDRSLVEERARRDAIARALEARALTAQRFDAQHKRCGIEVRALEQRAAQGSAGSAMPEDVAARCAALARRAEALRVELRDAEAAVRGSRAELDAAARRIAELDARVGEVERRKSGVRQRLRRRLGERSGGLAELEIQRRTALAELGRSWLVARTPLPQADSAVARVREADDAVLSLVERSELHLRALDAVDAVKLKHGLVWLASLVCALAAYAVYRLA